MAVYGEFVFTDAHKNPSVASLPDAIKQAYPASGPGSPIAVEDVQLDGVKNPTLDVYRLLIVGVDRWGFRSRKWKKLSD